MLGHYLDPVADKLLLSTLFLVLMHKGLIPVTVTVLVFGRDVGILLVAAILYMAVGRREFHPSVVWQGEYAGPDCGGGSGAVAPADGGGLGGDFQAGGAGPDDAADRGVGIALRVAGIKAHLCRAGTANGARQP